MCARPDASPHELPCDAWGWPSPRLCVPAAARRSLALCGCAVAASLAVAAVPRARALFLGRRGQAHRALGVAYALWLALGAVIAASSAAAEGAPEGTVASSTAALRASAATLSGRAALAAYDAALGVLGLALTLSARAFSRERERLGASRLSQRAGEREAGGGQEDAPSDARAKPTRPEQRAASGALGERATVSDGEIVEHAFYQMVNLLQGAFIHAAGAPQLRAAPVARLALALAVCLPWAYRARFPVNSFSANYAAAMRGDPQFDPWRLENVLYRLKKYQYLLYKHALLHGLNATVAAAALDLGARPAWRAYWLLLNASYVAEFFQQTLVKRKAMPQWQMLATNQVLMAMASYAALRVVLGAVCLPIAALSLALNFLRRGSELTNFAIVAAAAIAMQ